MKLKSIHLSHYRNYSNLQLELNDGLTILVGNNAQGKTNLLEAIFLLSVTKSHRTNHDQELIQWGQDFALVEGQVQTENYSYPLSLQISSKGKQAKFNYIDQAKLSSFIGKLNVILFAPEDLQIIKGAPGLRRKFIDTELGQSHPVYLQELLTYHRLLKQRNRYLKDYGRSTKFDDLYFEVLSQQFLEQAVKVIGYRTKFVQDLARLAQEIQEELSGQKDQLTISYDASHSRLNYQEIDQLAQAFTDLFAANQQREKDQGVTLYGPHRDDLSFYLDGKPAQFFGSQGQQRTIVLSLKLAEIELIKELKGHYPVLLLDDVLSELDAHRQTVLMTRIANQVQTVLTTASLDGLNLDHLAHLSIYQVDQGHLEKEK